MKESDREREREGVGERERESAEYASRRAINVNYLADAQFNKKGHYDLELEVTSTRALSPFPPGHPLARCERVHRNPPTAPCKLAFIARRPVYIAQNN